MGSALASYLQAGHAPDVELCDVVEFHDLLEPGSLRQMAQTYRPDWIIHLAAQSHVADSWNDPAATLQVNTTGTANLKPLAFNICGDQCVTAEFAFVVLSASVFRVNRIGSNQ